MPRREKEIHLKSNTLPKVYFTINKHDDLELKIKIDEVCTLEDSINKLIIEKPSGDSNLIENVKNIMDNVIEFEIPGNTFDEVGLHKGQVKIKDKLGNITSSIFNFLVNDILEFKEKNFKSICGEFKCGELLCGEELEDKQRKTNSNLSQEFFKSFGGELNE